MKISLLSWVIFRDVNRTIGGGIASMELLRRSGENGGWLDEDGHAVLTAVSRLTPGTNILAYCAALGWRLGGSLGVLVALVAASVPASVIVVALSATLVRVDRYFVVRLLIAIGVLAATVLVASGAWHLMRPYVNRRSAVRVSIITATAAGLMWLGVTPVRILLLSAAIGAFIGMPAAPVSEPLER